jgi:RNA polymerase primary sigma factor
LSPQELAPILVNRCNSAITIWRDELNDGKVLLRDIIDLEGTYAGPDAKSLPALQISTDGQMIVPGQLPTPNAAPVISAPFYPADKRDSDETAGERANRESDCFSPAPYSCLRRSRRCKHK